MMRLIKQTTHRFTAQLPPWLFLAGGVALLAITVLTPAWLECRQLQWRHNIMTTQAQRLSQQAESYSRFYHALNSQDPVLLERLAYHQMRLKPVGRQPLTAATPTASQTIENWLHTPLPRVGIDYPPPVAIQSRLTRLSTGPMRLGLLAVAILSITAALLWAGGEDAPTHRA